MIDTMEVSQTSEVRVFQNSFQGVSKTGFRKRALMKYAKALDTSIMMRITKIHTSNCT